MAFGAAAGMTLNPAEPFMMLPAECLAHALVDVPPHIAPPTPTQTYALNDVMACMLGWHPLPQPQQPQQRMAPKRVVMGRTDSASTRSASPPRPAASVGWSSPPGGFDHPAAALLLAPPGEDVALTPRAPQAPQQLGDVLREYMRQA